MNSKNEERHRVFKVGDREFRLNYQNDDSACLILPDFEMNPEYTEEGHPFMLLIHDECPECTIKGEICGGCDWFVHEQGCPIGICRNEVLSRSPTQKQKRDVTW